MTNMLNSHNKSYPFSLIVMVLQASGQISFSNIQVEFGGVNPIAISEYYTNSGTGYTSGIAGLPVSSNLPFSMSNFYGKTKETPLYSFSSFTFTNANWEGQDGPTLTTLKSSYSGTSWTQNSTYYSMVDQGIQRWTVPSSGTYRITAKGAAGSAYNTQYSAVVPYSARSKGASITGDFYLTQNQVINIVVGHRGWANNDGNNYAGGGGGGSFVYNQADNTLYVAAGGGGGNGSGSNYIIGGPGSATQYPVGGVIASGASWLTSSAGYSALGYGGNGGRQRINTLADPSTADVADAGGGGGGWNGSGGNGAAVGSNLAWWGYGGSGRTASQKWYGGLLANGEFKWGGFGGGGAGLRGGGGGGYTGGGGGDCMTTDYLSGAGEGGGSYNSGANQVNVEGGNTATSGHGSVTITKL